MPHVQQLETRTLLAALHPVDLGTTGFRLDGIGVGHFSRVSVSSAGDVNGDGFDDLIIGANQADPGESGDAGGSYMVFGGNFTGRAQTQVGDATANTFVNAIDRTRMLNNSKTFLVRRRSIICTTPTAKAWSMRSTGRSLSTTARRL